MERYGIPQELKNGLVLYLPGDISGTTAYDASGNGNNGTLNGSPTTQRRKGYKGIVYNGSSQWTNTSGNLFSITETTPFSLTTLFHPSNTTTGQLIGRHAHNTGSSIMQLYVSWSVNAGKLYASIGSSNVSDVAMETTETYGTSYPIAVTFTHDASKNMKLYVNGVLRASNTHTYSGLTTSTANWQFSSRLRGDGVRDAYFSGAEYDTLIHNVALDANMVNLLHKSLFIN